MLDKLLPNKEQVMKDKMQQENKYGKELQLILHN
jgi:hypothetical protein